MKSEQGLSAKQIVIVGLTLFSMFFGAGNLIFPPFLALQAGTSVVPAAIGFLISAVGLPILGVVAVARCGGLDQLANRVHPVFALVFTVLIYLSIGPFLAIPRTASTSFEMTVFPFVGENHVAMGQLIYSIVFFAIAGVVALNPAKLTDRLGKILCPILLLLICILFAGGALHYHPVTAAPAAAYQKAASVKGFLEGYLTMDTIAALNFGIIIALNIRALGMKEDRDVLRMTVRSGIIAGVLMILVYGALTFIGGQAGAMGSGQLDNGARILTYSARAYYGEAGAVLLGIIFFIACLNTCISLLCCCSEYFSLLIPKLSYRSWVLLFAVISMVFSNAGLSRILEISVPVLNALYPVSIMLILLSFADRGQMGRPVYLWTILFTGVISVFTGVLEPLGLVIPGISHLVSMLPGYSLGLSWILPAAAGAVLGVIADRLKGKKTA